MHVCKLIKFFILIESHFNNILGDVFGSKLLYNVKLKKDFKKI